MPRASASPKIHAARLDRNWYALFTRYQHEKSVAHSLSNKGFDTYLPLFRSVRRWQDRAKELWLPLFPSYVFLRGGMDSQMQILMTPGMLHVVAWGGRPAVVPAEQLDAVRRIIESCFAVEPHPFLQQGDSVRVIAGPLRGLEGLLIRKKGADRLVVSLEILSRSAAVEISLSQVERLGGFRVPESAGQVSASA